MRCDDAVADGMAAVARDKHDAYLYATTFTLIQGLCRNTYGALPRMRRYNDRDGNNSLTFLAFYWLLAALYFSVSRDLIFENRAPMNEKNRYSRGYRSPSMHSYVYIQHTISIMSESLKYV